MCEWSPSSPSYNKRGITKPTRGRSAPTRAKFSHVELRLHSPRLQLAEAKRQIEENRLLLDRLASFVSLDESADKAGAGGGRDSKYMFSSGRSDGSDDGRSGCESHRKRIYYDNLYVGLGEQQSKGASSQDSNAPNRYSAFAPEDPQVGSETDSSTPRPSCLLYHSSLSPPPPSPPQPPPPHSTPPLDAKCSAAGGIFQVLLR